MEPAHVAINRKEYALVCSVGTSQSQSTHGLDEFPAAGLAHQTMALRGATADESREDQECEQQAGSHLGADEPEIRDDLLGGVSFIERVEVQARNPKGQERLALLLRILDPKVGHRRVITSQLFDP